MMMALNYFINDQYDWIIKTLKANGEIRGGEISTAVPVVGGSSLPARKAPIRVGEGVPLKCARFAQRW